MGSTYSDCPVTVHLMYTLENGSIQIKKRFNSAQVQNLRIVYVKVSSKVLGLKALKKENLGCLIKTTLAKQTKKFLEIERWTPQASSALNA